MCEKRHSAADGIDLKILQSPAEIKYNSPAGGMKAKRIFQKRVKKCIM